MAKRTTRQQDMEFIVRRLADARRDWQPGDPCMPYRGTTPTTVLRIEGDTVYLANGESMHRSKMRRVPESN